ncbi:unnamed protein product [Brassica oleracea]
MKNRFEIGGGKAYFHGDGRHIGCREQEETSRARIRLDPSSPVSSLPPSPPVSSLPPSPPVSNSSPLSSLSLVLGVETEQRKTSRREAKEEVGGCSKEIRFRVN